ncbi:hypothetical protein B0H15DRAFT_139174 [Mycena belliarum]|uniref:Uncharacterized protein n=1 Tax=Mycena belliarum TaxID=1033014 RepID=A0AAD6TMG1_9AGAR|nr:hypothetical protein B0H15DRAFT_139174 [Mycena belliae]
MGSCGSGAAANTAASSPRSSTVRSISRVAVPKTASGADTSQPARRRRNRARRSQSYLWAASMLPRRRRVSPRSSMLRSTSRRRCRCHVTLCNVRGLPRHAATRGARNRVRGQRQRAPIGAASVALRGHSSPCPATRPSRPILRRPHPPQRRTPTPAYTMTLPTPHAVRPPICALCRSLSTSSLPSKRSTLTPADATSLRTPSARRPSKRPRRRNALVAPRASANCRASGNRAASPGSYLVGRAR